MPGRGSPPVCETIGSLVFASQAREKLLFTLDLINFILMKDYYSSQFHPLEFWKNLNAIVG